MSDNQEPVNEEVARNTRLCPRCKKPFVGWPAISRSDNKTEICSDCGVEEARNALFFYEPHQHN